MLFGVDQAVIAAYVEVIVINLVLSGDNVVVIGMAAAALPRDLRKKAIFAGITAAALIRVVFAIVAVGLLRIPGIMLLGGLLLLWVCWNLFKELYFGDQQELEPDMAGEGAMAVAKPGKGLRQAIIQIIVADVSMSLDNVLAVAGAASKQLDALVFGLILSVALMAVASTLVAALLARYRWIGWLGLGIIVYVAIGMLYDGGGQLMQADFAMFLSAGLDSVMSGG